MSSAGRLKRPSHAANLTKCCETGTGMDSVGDMEPHGDDGIDVIPKIPYSSGQ